MKSSQNKWKRDLFYLLNILVQRNPLIAHKKHIPIYLSSYQATMSSCDQLILNLLRFYELNSDIDFYEFRPFLFGSTALTHFSSLNQNELKISANSLDEVKKSYFKVINSFEKTIITNTIVNFPIKRKLVDYGLHELDQLLTKNNENEENSSDQIYDPENLLGLLPLGLSFEDLNMRLMTARILMKCRESIEGNKKKKELWIEFYEGIQKGLSKLKKIIPKGHKSGDKIEFPRVAPVSSQLLSEFFNVIPNKLHCVHSILANYVIVREIFDFATIPEFMILMCSYELNQEEHRLFLLNTINDGIRDELDFKLLNNTPIIKMLLSCFGTTISSRKIDLLILKIIDNLIVKAKATEFLTDRYGLLLWMYQVCINIEAFEYDSIDMIISIIDHLKEIFSNDAEKSKLIMSAPVHYLRNLQKQNCHQKRF
ncbi:hypothetical protein PVAND_017834 [Polypedilum vanderplanki]|uniref:URB1 C-terminal domain-containing protein n=1 Tax=Polypedilum vanderplanki TaxID=319348 RepID=A0A9J6B962_POLVA|nr:hypothetical protein PVAND_017834 [Polypedilum vanderplanki]